MMLLGYNSVLGGSNSYLVPRTNVNYINSMKLENAVYDRILVTQDLDYRPESPSYEWDQATILYGTFEQGNLAIGNIEFAINNTTDILVKRRKKGTFSWQIIYHKRIEKSSDFEFSFFDRYASSGITYEYGLVQVLGNIEGNLIITECNSEFDGCYILDKEQSFHLILNFKLDRQKNAPRSYVTGLNKKYPNIIQTSQANYYTGSVNATVVEYLSEQCSLDMEHAVEYRDLFMEFLTNGTAKILKTAAGQCYLISIVDTPSESSTEHWNLPSTSFSWIQVGSVDNLKDMATSQLLSIDTKWWVDE